MYRLLLIGFLITSVNLLFSQAIEGKNGSSGKPNFVLILVDDAALQDFGVYGGEAYTPNIDQLAHQGTMFTNYHSSLMCAPARAMLLTGCDSHLAGVPNLPVFLAPEHAAHPDYDGILNTRVETVSSRLKSNGYNTYIAGKWHLGNTSYTLPTRRGFDRSFILGASGGDNYDIKGYLPFKGNAPWFADGEALEELPDDFYSSEYLVDKMMEFMDEEPNKDQPFFSYLPFQAVHIPVQAPAEFVKKYKGIYKDGWDKLKQQRFEKAKQLGLVQKDATMEALRPELRDWKELSKEEQQIAANDMAVNAAMLEAMDYHIGRYITYLKSKGLYDNTVFIITSDNGPEGSVVKDNPAEMWMKWVGYHRDQTRLGGPGYYGFIGPEMASAAAGPSSFFKFYAGEGGLRVPLIIAGKDIPKAQKRSAFSFVTDVAPTILALAGIQEKASLVPMTGKSLLPAIQNDSVLVYQDDEPIGVEAAGHSALFKGGFKLTRNARPLGDFKWRLYNLKNDPGETDDIAQSHPQLFAELIRDYADYSETMGVLEMGTEYEAQAELSNKIRAIISGAIRPWLIGFIISIIGIFLWRRKKRRMQENLIPTTAT
ncbi:MAG: arylsulfatase A-like enzyme [Saprospiraceae bacterium]|jgi:arylsulfatase A-like enzyme